MPVPPRSERFDDVYFSAHDGLAETRHVFLDGNDLPDSWAGKRDFVIGETGFGTGLNFLATCEVFEKTRTDNQNLHFISFEQFPLEPHVINDALSGWADELEPHLSSLIRHYPLRIPGFHRLLFGDHITLTLIFDEALPALSRIDHAIDCWFLDGFKPATNPDMWRRDVITEIARLSRPGTRFATFTAAGDVRRRLTDAGFEVSKTQGFGRKRDMLTGVFRS